MDADFSHNPADVPRLVAALDAGADFVIGSRYVPGGRAPADWGPLRRTFSLLANLGARFIAGLHDVHDSTNGFRAVRAALLRRIPLAGAAPKGYAILMYLIYQAQSLGARLVEVPVTFANREHGESKLRLSDALELVINIWWVRYDRREKFYRLAAGGLSGVAANLAAVALLYQLLGLAPALASALALEVAVLYSFAWNRLWMVIARRPAPAQLLTALARFHLISLPSFLLTLGAFLILTGVWGVHPVAAQAFGIIPALFWNYFLGERLLTALWGRLRRRFDRYRGELERV
jgi:dolichol-phosphate mannosyltransferase